MQLPNAESVPHALRQTATELRRMVGMSVHSSAMTQALEAMAANYDALAAAEDVERSELVHTLLMRLIGEYLKMGWLLNKAQRLLSAEGFAQFLTVHEIDPGLAVHAMQLAEDRFPAQ